MRPPPGSASAVRRKALLVPPLLFALYLLTDDDASADAASDAADAASDAAVADADGPPPPSTPPPSRHHHLAVLTALRRHPPSLRVFRALSELDLLLICASLSLWAWERGRIGRELGGVGRMLFEPPGGMEEYEIEFEGGEEEEEEEGGAGGGGGGGGGEKDSAYETSSREDRGGDGGGDRGGGDGRRRLRSRDDGDVPMSACDAETPLSDDERSESPVSDPPSISRCLRPSEPVPPPASSAASAALDLLLLILVCLFLFTLSSAEGGRYIDGINDEGSPIGAAMRALGGAAAPIFPLALFFAASSMAMLPWRRRRAFWRVVSYTVMAPYREVTFRDGFVGDVLTSAVRPLQDVAFTLFYLLSGLRGWWSASYDIDDAALPLERSWLLHTAVLPACMVSPLWWRFLQNLRQAYDSRRRWPYLGNALKYFVAAEVALFGVFDPGARRHWVWLMCFTAATLYQVWWDVFMDWELLVWVGWGEGGAAAGAGGAGAGMARRRWWPLALRPTRLYSSALTYHSIFVINFLLRFCWTLSFIPRTYLSRSGTVVDAFGADFRTFAGPALASAEIIRRTLWGLLRVEMEAIKTSGIVGGGGVGGGARWGSEGAAETRPARAGDVQSGSGGVGAMADDDDDFMDWDLSPMSIGTGHGAPGGGRRARALGPLLESSAVVFQSDMSTSSDVQIMGELCLWGTAFASLGILAAAHRQVM